MGDAHTRNRPRRAARPIVNIGRFRLDPPGRARSLKDNLKFLLFVLALLGLFIWLSRLQADWLTSRNAAQQTPALIPAATQPAPP